MDPYSKDQLKIFIIRVSVTTASIILILFLTKTWFFTTNNIRYVNKESQATGLKQETLLNISLKDTSKNIGNYVTVKGKITKSHNSGKACFLNFTEGYTRYLTAVIFASSFNQFPSNPEQYYLNKTVNVIGTIKEYEGSPEIILNHQDQIQIVYY